MSMARIKRSLSAVFEPLAPPGCLHGFYGEEDPYARAGMILRSQVPPPCPLRRAPHRFARARSQPTAAEAASRQAAPRRPAPVGQKPMLQKPRGSGGRRPASYSTAAHTTTRSSGGGRRPQEAERHSRATVAGVPPPPLAPPRASSDVQVFQMTPGAPPSLAELALAAPLPKEEVSGCDAPDVATLCTPEKFPRPASTSDAGWQQGAKADNYQQQFVAMEALAACGRLQMACGEAARAQAQRGCELLAALAEQHVASDLEITKAQAKLIKMDPSGSVAFQPHALVELDGLRASAAHEVASLEAQVLVASAKCLEARLVQREATQRAKPWLEVLQQTTSQACDAEGGGTTGAFAFQTPERSSRVSWSPQFGGMTSTPASARGDVREELRRVFLRARGALHVQ